MCVCVRAVCETQCERQNFLRPSLSRFMAQVDDLPIAKCFRQQTKLERFKGSRLWGYGASSVEVEGLLWQVGSATFGVQAGEFKIPDSD